jgi:hypothetical protein
LLVYEESRFIFESAFFCFLFFWTGWFDVWINFYGEGWSCDGPGLDGGFGGLGVYESL